jgi:hypothetical protein
MVTDNSRKLMEHGNTLIGPLPLRNWEERYLRVSWFITEMVIKEIIVGGTYG